MSPVSPIVFERLHAGITREVLAAASGIPAALLEAAERCEAPLTIAQEAARLRALAQLIDGRLREAK